MSNDIEYWLTVISEDTSGWTGWQRFYQKYIGQPLVHLDKLQRAVQLYGKKIVFEAVIASSIRTFEGDALPYVLAVASRMAITEAEQISEEARYKMNLERSKQRVVMQNEEIENKLEKARERYGKESQ